MAIVKSYSSAQGVAEGRPIHYVVDLTSELPASPNIGDTAFCKQTNYFMKSQDGASWTNQGSGGGAADFADLTGTASVAQGGTGASNATEARTALGLGSLATASSVAFSDVTGSIALGAQSGNLLLSYVAGTLSIASGGTGASNASSVRSNLGLGTAATSNSGDFAAFSHTHAIATDLTGSLSLVAQSGLLPLATGTSGTLSMAAGGTGTSNAADARTNLGLGSLATQSGTFSGTSSGTNTGDLSLSGTPDYITISGQVITRGEVDLASDITGTLSVARGGTNASSASGARTNLGLGDVSTLNTNASTVNFLRGDGQWITPSAGSVAASDITGSLSLLTQSGQLRLADGTTGTLAVVSGGTGAANAASARTNLGLGTLATANSITLTTDTTGTLSVGEGGTNASNAADARTNLGLGSISTLSSVTLVTNTTGTLSVAQGGTGASSGSAAYTNLGTMGASNLSGTVAIVNGGTGQSNVSSAINALLPSQSGNSGKYLTTDATNVSWGTVVGGSPFTTVRKTGVDQGSSGTSLLNSVNQMDFTLASSTNYVFEYWIRYQTAAATTGLVLGLQTAQTPVGLWMHWTTPLAATGTITGGSAIGSNTTLSIASGNVSAGGVHLAYLTGMVMGGATGGTMALRWCSEVTGSMCTIKTGTMGRIMSIT